MKIPEAWGGWTAGGVHECKPTPFDCLFRDVKEFKKAKERKDEMSNRTEWITDRRPSREDASAAGNVLTFAGAQNWECIIAGEKWIPMPVCPRTLEDVARDLVEEWGQLDHLPFITNQDLAPLMDELKQLVEGEEKQK